MGSASKTAVGLTVVLALLAGGCSGNPSSPPTQAAETVEFFEQALTQARAGGASEAQVLILERALAAGEVTLADSRAAADALMACAQDAGFSVSPTSIDNSTGIETITFYLTNPGGLSQDQADAVAWDCETKHRRWVETAYQNQPNATSAFFDLIERHRVEIVACLREQGSSVADDATPDELISETLRTSTEAIESGELNVSDCLYQSGISM